MNDKLLPCPFCGGEAELRQWSAGMKYYRVECKNTSGCDCHGIDFHTPEQALAAWNRRATTCPTCNGSRCDGRDYTTPCPDRQGSGTTPAPFDAYPAHADDWLRLDLMRDVPTDDLRALCDAWREGRALILPCKVGDMVNTPEGTGIVRRWEHVFFVTVVHGTQRFDYNDHDFGSVVTRSAAEAARAGEEGDHE